MATYHIHITGRVQGVGFRPFIYRLAQRFQLKGWLKNTEDGVHIQINADETTAYDFVKYIVEEQPAQAIIEQATLKIAPPQYFEHFYILESGQSDANKGNINRQSGIKITPDFATCSNCKTALFDPHNRRFGYAFITCTDCGPRYSIQTQTPFDRETTTMQAFTVCETCKAEYNTPSDVRFYSQTNSCANCGIQLSLFDKTKRKITVEDPIDYIVQAIQQGKIVAVKGIGGYLLLGDATNETAIQALRQRKNRPRKPFAVLYPNLEVLKKDVYLTDSEEKLLLSEKSPIVLVKIKKQRGSSIAVENIAPNLNKIGVMLPYAPLLCLITEGVSKPVIATSGNISGAPIIYKDEEALDKLPDFADLVVTHNRQIVVPQDDSVVQLADEKPILLRRSRGYAPAYFGILPEKTMDGIIAMGADLKATIGISHQQAWTISQYLGNQETYEAQQSYDTVTQHLIQLTGVKPHIILVDQHPMYHTRQKGLDWAKRDNLTVVSIPHHEAHFAAVLQENDLIETEIPILGVIWDGTGYGSDGNSWGGEFFTYQNQAFQRIFHLNYVPLIVGDKMAREPRISALAFCSNLLKEVEPFLSKKFFKNEWAIYSKMLAQPDLFTSSMGRLFDAVACLLGLIDKASYEGEAALYLQHLAENTDLSRDNREGGDNAMPYAVVFNEHTIDTDVIIKNILNDLQKGIATSEIALKFHLTLVQIIRFVAEKSNCSKIAFSGGVFQNSLLVQLIMRDLKEYDLYVHKELSPNDENIAFGQLAHYHIQLFNKD